MTIDIDDEPDNSVTPESDEEVSDYGYALCYDVYYDEFYEDIKQGSNNKWS